MITYKKGNVLDQVFDKPTIIAHICNDAGGFGSGFAGAVKQKYASVKRVYHEWHENNPSTFKLGKIQLVPITNKDYICNMIAQSKPGGVTFKFGSQTVFFPPIRYQSLEECLLRIKSFTYGRDVNIVGPKFGAGLAGGDWSIIEEIINRVGLDITIYELEN